MERTYPLLLFGFIQYKLPTTIKVKEILKMKEVKKIAKLFRKHKLFSSRIFLTQIAIVVAFIFVLCPISTDSFVFILACFYLFLGVSLGLLIIVICLTYKGKLTLSLLTQEQILIVFFQLSYFFIFLTSLLIIFFLTLLVLILFCRLGLI